MFGGPDRVIYSTSMGPERDSEPLVSPRGDEPDDGPVAAGEPQQPSGTAPAAEPRQPASAAPPGEPLAEPASPATRAPESGAGAGGRSQSPNMLPAGRVRSGIERKFVRVIATGGIVGIGVAIAAIMASSNSQGWLIGLVVSAVSVVLAALLWSSRVL
jgi:hypothetical protein